MDLNEIHALKRHNGKKKFPQDPRDPSSRGKNARHMERLAESAKGVTCTSQKCISSVDKGKKTVNAVSVSSSDSGESLFKIQLTPEIDPVHVIQSNNPTKITVATKLNGGPNISMQIGSRKQIKSSKCTMYNTSTVGPLGKCKVQLTNSRDKRKYKHNLTIVEDKHCANLIASKTAQQMQRITIRNDIRSSRVPNLQSALLQQLWM